MARAQSLWAPLLVGTWLLGLIPFALSSAPLTACLAPTLVVWLATVILRPREGWALAATITASSVGIIWITDGGVGSSETPAAAAWFDAAAVAAGLGMATLRRSVLAVAAVAAVAIVSWTIVAATGPLDGGWRTTLAWPAATLGGGLAVALALAVIRQGAVRLDRVREMTQSAASDEEVARAARDRLQLFARLLHDTVVNTLGAVGRGLPPESKPQLAERCRYDLSRLAAADPVPPEDLIAFLRERAGALGVSLSIHGRAPALDRLSAPVSSAAAVALSEALLNTSKHSAASRADLTIAERDGSVELRLTDRGRGWSGSVPPGGGIANSIIGRSREAGIATAIDTEPGEGTTVTLIAPPARQPQERVEGAIQTEVVALGAMACGAIVVDVGIRTALTIGLYPAAGQFASYAILVGALALAYRALDSRGTLRHVTWAVLPLALAAIIPLLPDEAIGPLSWGWWATIASLPLLAALLLLNAPLSILIGAYAIQTVVRIVVNPYHPADIVIPGVISVAFTTVLLWLVRERIYSLLLRYDQTAAVLSEQRRRTVAQLAGQRSGALQLHRALEPARSMLTRLADGSADCDDPAVRRWCADEAGHLRKVSMLGPYLAEADAGLLDLLSDYRRSGTEVRVAVNPHVRLPDPPARAALGGLLTAARDSGNPLGGITLSLLHRTGRDCLALVAEDGTWSLPPEDLAQARSAGLAVEWIGGSEGAALEISWPASEPAGDAAGYQSGRSGIPE